MIERVFILKRTDAFRDLSTDVLERLAPHLVDVELERGDRLFEKGEIGTSMFIVVDGQVRIHHGERTLASLGPGSVLGEFSVLSSEERSASATADTEARLLRLDQDVLYELMALTPAVSRGLIEVLLDRLR
ncbi:MAG: cyclic nucleotide-binding domain-containing protein [Gemmatimonadota bacterium]|nr:cyclic nucleotide-binding domain-containing protein [Gemmatimonadota bacterium]